MTLSISLLLGFIAHFVGDYILQSHWMAVKKTSEWGAALAHGFTYTLPFLFITQNIFALLIIGGTHVIIDKYRLAKYLTWAKNQIGPKQYRTANPWAKPKAIAPMVGVVYPISDSLVADPTTGYPTNTPAWLSNWLLFIADNTVHIIINSLALWMVFG